MVEAGRWSALQDAIAGDVIVPGSPAYVSAARPAIARFHDVLPQAVVRCRTAPDVAETIAFARRAGAEMAVRSGGHCFAGRSSSRGIVIDVGPMDSVSVADGVATVGAGARLGDVYDALAEEDLTIAGGCGTTVGIAGLALGGGLGILGRMHGLTSDQLVAAQVVLADGRIVECDEHHHDDLFWALRGAGGGQFGVVTTLRLRALAAPAATSFHLRWPDARAAEVISAWQTWAPTAPDELAASLLVTAGPDPDRPPVVNVFGAMQGSKAATTELLGELVARAGAGPDTESLLEAPYREVKEHLAGLDPSGREHEGPSPGASSEPGHDYCKSEFFARPLPYEAIAALMDHLRTDRVAGQHHELDFTPWGGAYRRVPAGATAFAHRDALFLLKHGLVLDPEAPADRQQRARDWLERSWSLVHPRGTGGAYPNFPDPELADWARAYHGTNHERLLRVKRAYDPDDVFRFPQALGLRSPSAAA